jgi:hypothetical protein
MKNNPWITVKDYRGGHKPEDPHGSTPFLPTGASSLSNERPLFPWPSDGAPVFITGALTALRKSIVKAMYQ